MNRPVRFVWAVRHQVVAHRLALFDVAVAAVTMGVEFDRLSDGKPPMGMPAIVLTAASGIVLLARRHAPLAVLAATIAAAWVLAATDAYPGGAPVVVALAGVAETRERRVSVAAAVPTALFLLLASISSIPVSVAAWAVGSYMQTRRRYVQALEERADQLEREHRQLALLAAKDGRTAIARELHDIVAHSVTVMLLGVRGARDVLPTAPDVAARTLERVEATAEESLTELRRMLTVLRDPDQDAGLRPQPSLAQLPALVTGYRDAGMPVDLETSGERRPLPGGVELSAYRIVEEALTNVLKHADPQHVAVLLGYGPAELTVTIEDDGPHRPSGTGGHGLAGMRERAAVLGGSLDALPVPGGGFRVAARLPVAGP